MQNTAPYKYVAVVGIDGMGSFNRLTETARMDEIFKNGAVTYDALSMNPTISAENWGAMLLGANPVIHGLTNGSLSRHEYDNEDLPSVFARIRRAFPQSYLASCCNWNPINRGIIEHEIGVDMFTADSDAELTPIIEETVAKKPTFLFVQLDDVDGAGHHFGYGTRGHLDKITETDALVGRIYDAYKAAGILGETLFIAIADHGGIRCGHGGYMNSEKYIFFAAAGKGVPAGSIGRACTKDIAATVLCALGLAVPQYDVDGFSSQVPSGIFSGVGADYYLPEAKEHYIEPKATAKFGAENGLAKFLPKAKIRLALFFDDNLADASGRHSGSEHGAVKFYSGGVRGSYAELGKTGSVAFEDIKLGLGSFSLALWLKIDRSIDGEAVLCANKDWSQSRSEAGFALALRCADTQVSIGAGNDDFTFITPFPQEISGGWIHTIIAFDKEKKELRCYYNFRLAHASRLEDGFICELDNLPFTVGDDAVGEYNREAGDYLVYEDDFLLLDGVLTDDEIKSFAKYYEQ